MLYTIFSFLSLVIIISALTVVALTVEKFTRYIIQKVVHLFYKIRIEGEENIPKEGGVLIVANHVSFIDWIVIALAAKRKVCFVMYYIFFKIPLMNLFFKKFGAIPIAGRKEDPKILEESFNLISQALKRGEIVCIFPEGQLTLDGQLSYFRPGLERILKTDPVPVVPIVIKGLWGSIFSKKHASWRLKFKLFPKQFGTKIEVFVDKIWEPENASAKELESYYREQLKFDTVSNLNYSED